jgi:chaperonin cofactor prefoldin
LRKKEKLDKELDFLNATIRKLQSLQEALKKEINSAIEKKPYFF